jgi:hypothetical protein
MAPAQALDDSKLEELLDAECQKTVSEISSLK